MGYRLQQLEICQSLWRHRHVDSVCVITISARRVSVFEECTDHVDRNSEPW